MGLFASLAELNSGLWVCMCVIHTVSMENDMFHSKTIQFFTCCIYKQKSRAITMDIANTELPRVLLTPNSLQFWVRVRFCFCFFRSNSFLLFVCWFVWLPACLLASHEMRQFKIRKKKKEERKKEYDFRQTHTQCDVKYIRLHHTKTNSK